MADVGVRVTLEGMAEVERGLGTLEDGLRKLAERNPENARKLAEAANKTADALARVEEKNRELIVTTKEVLDLDEKKILAAQRLEEARAKMDASNAARAQFEREFIGPISQTATGDPRSFEEQQRQDEGLQQSLREASEFTEQL